MKNLIITDSAHQTITDSETVNACINYLITSFKPSEHETVFLTELPVPFDPGNEYAFALTFYNENENEDMEEEIEAYFDDLGEQYKGINDSDFLVEHSILTVNTYTTYVLLTFQK